jgi:uncharacterized protein YciI
MNRLLAIFIFFASLSFAAVQDKPAEENKARAALQENRDSVTVDFIKQEIARAKTYYLVFLKLGPAERKDKALLNELQMKHLQHLFKLRALGKLVLQGPLLVDSQLRGIGIFNAASQEEVREYMNADPLVKAGYLTVEIYPWMGLPGDKLP